MQAQHSQGGEVSLSLALLFNKGTFNIIIIVVIITIVHLV